MKVLLKQDIENIGMAGELHQVANGYGRNYLIPKGLAVTASPGMLKQAAAWRKKAETRRTELRAEYEALSASIEAVSLTFTARAGATGKLYGSITTSQIADELNAELGTEIDRRKVGVEPLRQLGEHKVVVRLSGEFQPEITVVIENEDGEVELTEIEEVEIEVETAEPESEPELEDPPEEETEEADE